MAQQGLTCHVSLLGPASWRTQMAHTIIQPLARFVNVALCLIHKLPWAWRLLIIQELAIVNFRVREMAYSLCTAADYNSLFCACSKVWPHPQHLNFKLQCLLVCKCTNDQSVVYYTSPLCPGQRGCSSPLSPPPLLATHLPNAHGQWARPSAFIPGMQMEMRVILL